MPKQNPTSFFLNIYEGRRSTGEAVWTEQGEGDAWRQLDVLRLPGFDGRVILRLDGFWQAALASPCARFEAEITGLETIVKFGNTQQLRTLYTVVLEAEYAADNG